MISEIPELSPDQLSAATDALVAQLADLFTGKHPAVIGAALSEITGVWLAGHIDADAKDNVELHKELMRNFLKNVAVISRITAALPAEPQDTVQ
jgi:hypothetical protein